MSETMYRTAAQTRKALNLTQSARLLGYTAVDVANEPTVRRAVLRCSGAREASPDTWAMVIELLSRCSTSASPDPGPPGQPGSRPDQGAAAKAAAGKSPVQHHQGEGNVATTTKKAPAKASAKKATPASAPAATREPQAKFDACPECGFKFKNPQARCNTRTACQRRKDGISTRGTGTPKAQAAKAAGTAQKASSGGTTNAQRTARLRRAQAQAAALATWKAAGEEGERPATPDLDAMTEEYEAKEAAKKAALAAKAAKAAPKPKQHATSLTVVPASAAS